MKDYARIVTKIRETAWLMTPEALHALLCMVDERITNGKLSDDELLSRLSEHDRTSLFHDGAHDSVPTGVNSDGIGVIPLYGPIFGKANMMTEMSGATSLEEVSNTLNAMLNDSSVSSIVLDVDSPGGTSDMVQEVGEQIAVGKEHKPIYAIANVMAGSAAYWIASQATNLYSTPSGSVGSVGVYSVHEDQSVKDANEGVKYTFISAGEHKTEGNPHEPLSSEGREYRQEIVDGMYDEFVNNVAKGRGISAEAVLRNFGQGRMVRPEQAMKARMIDGVTSFSNLIGAIANQPRRVKVKAGNGNKSLAVAKSAMNQIAELGNLNYTTPITTTAEGNSDYALLFPDGTLHMESKEWEHSEPGTGSPPQPRTDEDGSDDPAIKQGWRRDTPPIVYEPGYEVPNTKSVGRRVRMDEFVFAGKDARELFRALNLSEDTNDPAKVVEALKVQFGELEALRSSVSAAEQEKIFAETYPQYWEEHRKLMERDREHTAANFVGGVTTIRKTEGYGLKNTKQQLSVEAQRTLMESHTKFANGQGSLEDFEAAIKAVTQGGIVQFGEIGKSDGEDIPEYDTNTAAGVAGARRLFAEQVAKAQKDNPGMSYTDALAEAGKKHPDLAEAYKITLPA